MSYGCLIRVATMSNLKNIRGPILMQIKNIRTSAALLMQIKAADTKRFNSHRAMLRRSNKCHPLIHVGTYSDLESRILVYINYCLLISEKHR